MKEERKEKEICIREMGVFEKFKDSLRIREEGEEESHGLLFFFERLYRMNQHVLPKHVPFLLFIVTMCIATWFYCTKLEPLFPAWYLKQTLSRQFVWICAATVLLTAVAFVLESNCIAYIGYRKRYHDVKYGKKRLFHKGMVLCLSSDDIKSYYRLMRKEHVYPGICYEVVEEYRVRVRSGRKSYYRYGYRMVSEKNEVVIDSLDLFTSFEYLYSRKVRRAER